MTLIQITQPVADSVAAIKDTAAAITSNITSPIMPPTEVSLSLWDLIVKGGIIMIPIGILSLLAIYFIVERIITIRSMSRFDKNFMNNMRDYVSAGNIESAKILCKSTNNPVARMIEKGLSRIGKPIKEIEAAMENTGKLEIYKLEKNLNVLGIIAGIAPMLGFVGTIMGVIKIFYNIALADNISIGLIAGGLYEKMVTSAAGLIVGIFSFIAYHWLNAMVDRATHRMEANVIEFLDLLQEPSK